MYGHSEMAYRAVLAFGKPNTNFFATEVTELN